MLSLKEYRKNVYSANGEDGVIEEICSRLGMQTGSFVEFGAWDGKLGSNTYHLLEQGWKGVYIEGDKTRFGDLVNNMKSFQERITVIQAWVKKEGDNSLDNILAGTDIKKSFDLLSIDIDSYDWHVWKSLKNYLPKIVIIEINSCIPVGIYQTHRNHNIQGSSFTSTLELGRDMGYTLVCHIGNMIFVKKDLVEKLSLSYEELKYPELLFDYHWIGKQFVPPAPPTLSPSKHLPISTRVYKKLSRYLRKFFKY